jgi:ATP synthase protein I
MMIDREGRNDSRPGPSSSPKDAGLSDRLQDLDRRLDANRAARRSEAPAPDGPPKPGMATALRMGADFVAGVVIGAALGYGFDRLFGTSPWGLAIFLLLGFAAGVVNVMRSAGVVTKAPGGGDDFSRRK